MRSGTAMTFHGGFTLAVFVVTLLQAARACTPQQAAQCHSSAICEDGACKCPTGLYGTGYGEDGCDRNAWALRFNLTLPRSADVENGQLPDWLTYAQEYAGVLTDGSVPHGFIESMQHSVTDDGDSKILTVVALFLDQASASVAHSRLDSYLAASESTCVLALPEVDLLEGKVRPSHFDLAGPADEQLVSDWISISGEGDEDDEYFNIGPLGFPFCVNGIDVSNETYVSSNSYFTFTDGDDEYCENDCDATHPDIPTMFIGGYDCVAHNIRRRNIGKDAVKIRFEGELYYHYEYSSTIIWEATFFANNSVMIESIRDPRSAHNLYYESGLSDGEGTWLIQPGSMPVLGSPILLSGPAGTCGVPGVNNTADLTTVTPAFPTAHAGLDTWVQVGYDEDDDYWRIGGLGFPFCIDGEDVSSQVYVSSNSYLTFGEGYDDICEGEDDCDASFPDVPTLFVGGYDTVINEIYRRDLEGAVVLRFEGFLYDADDANTTIVWEVAFFSDNTIRIVSGIDTRNATHDHYVVGLSNGEGTWIQRPEDASFLDSPVLFSSEMCNGSRFQEVEFEFFADFSVPLQGETEARTIMTFLDDDYAFAGELPFPFCINGTDVSKDVYVSSNSALLFGRGEFVQCRGFDDCDASDPSLPSLFVGGYDTVAHFVTRRDIGSEAVVLRYEGKLYDEVDGDFPGTTVVWEVSLFANNTLKIESIADVRCDTDDDYVSGLSDGAGLWVVRPEDMPFLRGPIVMTSQEGTCLNPGMTAVSQEPREETSDGCGASDNEWRELEDLNESEDDYERIELPFPFYIEGVDVSKQVYISTQSYITFSDGFYDECEDDGDDCDATYPDVPTLFIGGDELVSLRVWTRNFGNESVVVHWQGELEDNDEGDVMITWEATFYPDNSVRVAILEDVRVPLNENYESGFSNGKGGWLGLPGLALQPGHAYQLYLNASLQLQAQGVPTEYGLFGVCPRALSQSAAAQVFQREGTPPTCGPPLANARGCNLWVANDLSLGTGDIGGKVCVGGDLTIDEGFSMGSALPQSPSCSHGEYSLVVGGDLRWNAGRKYVGSHCVAGSIFEPSAGSGPTSYPGCAGDRQGESCSDIIDFAADHQRLMQTSDEFFFGVAGLYQSTASLNAGLIDIVIDASKPMHAVSLDATLFQGWAAWGLRISAHSGSLDDVNLIVINLVNVPSHGLVIAKYFDYSAELASRVLFNYPGTYPIAVGGGATILGSVLAPRAPIAGYSAGTIKGQVVVDSYLTSIPHSRGTGFDLDYLSAPPICLTGTAPEFSDTVHGQLSIQGKQAEVQVEELARADDTSSDSGSVPLTWVVVSLAAFCAVLVVLLVVVTVRGRRSQLSVEAAEATQPQVEKMFVQLHGQQAHDPTEKAEQLMKSTAEIHMELKYGDNEEAEKRAASVV